MLFYSVKFVVFFLILLLIYYILPDKMKKYVLLGFNIIFYVSFGIKAAILIAVLSIIVYTIGILVEKYKKKARVRKWLFLLAIVLLIGTLVVLKYSDFVLSSIRYIFTWISVGNIKEGTSLVLPVGLSFYTFQALGYLIDVHNGKYKAERNFAKLAIFLTFFPTILSGPILRYDDFALQSHRDIRFDFEHFKDGFLLFIFGLFQKLVVADRIGIIVDASYENYMTYNGFMVVIIAAFYSLQIYFDFVGYSNMAIGLSKMLNISLKENFNVPYFSQSIAEFWRRWHISLSSWFRDYVYIPLGGSRNGQLKRLINLMIVFGLSGLWHGAAWCFVAWGAIHGIYQVIQIIDKPVKEKAAKVLKVDASRKATKIIAVMWNFLLVSYAWIFFRADSVGQALKMVLNTFKSFNPWVFFDGSIYNLGLTQMEFHVLIFAMLILFIVDLLKYLGYSMVTTVNNQQTLFRWGVYLFLIFSVLIYGIYGSNYDANNFIYFNF